MGRAVAAICSLVSDSLGSQGSGSSALWRQDRPGGGDPFSGEYHLPRKLRIGDHVWIGDEVLILSLDHITIASHVCISQRAFLCTGSHRFESENFDLCTKPIMIHEGCWIAANVFVGAGVTLDKGTL